MGDQIKIGYNPEDRFLVSLGTTLLVITQEGKVFGARMMKGRLRGSVQAFSGAKIGFNPQDRFMLAVGNTLVVITRDGSVFGADVDVAAATVGPVYSFSGAKIGFNPQDRFMVAVGDPQTKNTLMVITQDGSVFGSDVVGHGSLSPVYALSGAKIGFNPQDRFMVAVAKTLIVITQDGSAFASDVSGHTMSPVYSVGGAKIGYNAQDRFMVAMGNTLIVTTQSGDVWGSVMTSRTLGPVFQANPPDMRRLIEISRINGTPWVNPACDTSAPDWSSQVVGNHTFDGSSKHKFEWVSVLNPSLEQDDEVGVSGIAVAPDDSSHDVPFTHPFGNDFEFCIAVDDAYEGLLAAANKDPNGNYRDEWAAAQASGIAVRGGLLALEVDGPLVPAEYRVNNGDDVAIYGRWIVDAGHDDFHTEIHPPLLMAFARSVDDAGNPTAPNAKATTLFRLWSRPYQAAQLFTTNGDTGLNLQDYCTAIAETLGDVNAYPPIFAKPFDGGHLVAFTVRPPVDKPLPEVAWQLQCSYHFTHNGSSGVEVIQSPADPNCLLVIVSLNSAAYPKLPPPAQTYDAYSISELLKSAPGGIDLGFLETTWLWIKDHQGKVHVRRFFGTPAKSPQDTINVIPFTAVSGIAGKPGAALDNNQPFPIYGWVKLRWSQPVNTTG